MSPGFRLRARPPHRSGPADRLRLQSGLRRTVPPPLQCAASPPVRVIPCRGEPGALALTPVLQNDHDAGTEELGHLEMVAAIVHQLTRNLSAKEIENSPLAPYFVDHTTGVYPTAASGFPWSAGSIQSTGDPIADLTEDLAAEQKARLTYDNILRLSDDPDVNDAIRFLREREIVHFQRFGEALELARRRMNEKNIYLFNPGFDQK